jgi:hypothetical protein
MDRDVAVRSEQWAPSAEPDKWPPRQLPGAADSGRDRAITGSGRRGRHRPSDWRLGASRVRVIRVRPGRDGPRVLFPKSASRPCRPRFDWEMDRRMANWSAHLAFLDEAVVGGAGAIRRALWRSPRHDALWLFASEWGEESAPAEPSLLPARGCRAATDKKGPTRLSGECAFGCEAAGDGLAM